jgi:hypothetical protein
MTVHGGLERIHPYPRSYQEPNGDIHILCDMPISVCVIRLSHNLYGEIFNSDPMGAPVPYASQTQIEARGGCFTPRAVQYPSDGYKVPPRGCKCVTEGM